MTRTSRLLAALLAIALCATFAASASADTTAAKSKNKVSLKIKGDSQSSILKKGVKVQVKAKGKLAKKAKKGKKVSVKVKLSSSTFDSPNAGSLAKAKKVKIKKSGKGTATIKLSSDGKSQVSTCQARTLEITAKGSSAKADLVRDTGACKPQKIDLSQAANCDFIGDQDSSRCLLPFPDDYYTVEDPDTDTGRRLALNTAAMPKNTTDQQMDAAPYNLSDGFSPGQAITLRVPGLDNPDALDQTGAVPLSDLGQYTQKNAPVVVIDATTGERWPIWVEIDSNATSPEDTALLIHPAKNFASGHRYIVAMRNLKDEGGATLNAPEGFRYYRDDLPSSKGPINDQRGRFENIFKKLQKAKIKRADLYLAWDFTVASDENIAKNTLPMRNDAFSQLGDTNLSNGIVEGDAPEFEVTSVQNFTTGQDANMARRVQGTFTVPCYMTTPAGGNPCDPGARINLDSNGVPQQNGTWTANFNCMIPHAAVDDVGASPARPTVYGHGLLGSAGEATSGPQKTLGQTHNIMDCATDEIGMAGTDVGNTIGILQNMSDFPELADRLQQGMINGLYLGRLLDTTAAQGGFISDPAFRQNDAGPVDGTNPAVIDTSKLYYNGNSQGAIFGGALTALSPDFTRSSLGVGGMNYSVLLNRSVDFDTYKAFLDPAYPSEVDQKLILSLVQILWDRGETNGYAHRMTDNPLPGTPPHEILLNIAVGDHQVSNFAAETEARTIGTAKIHVPMVEAGRWPGVDVGWGIDPISSYPYSGGSAIVYWDGGPIRDDPDSVDPADVLGTDVPPIENLANDTGEDPHSLPRATPAEQQMVSDFLQPDNVSNITDTCNGAPCFDFNYTP